MAIGVARARGVERDLILNGTGAEGRAGALEAGMAGELRLDEDTDGLQCVLRSLAIPLLYSSSRL